MSTYRLGARQVYDTVMETLGGQGVNSTKQTSLQRSVQGGLSHILTYHPWTWRRRRVDLYFTASSKYFEMPEDFESLAEAEICRADPNDGVTRTIYPAMDRDFHRNSPAGMTGTPTQYRVVPSSHTQNTNSSWWYVVEPAPVPDGRYTWPGVEYYRSVPKLAFSGSTGTVPDMPTEFFDLWVLAAEWRGARTFGRHDLARQLKDDLEEGLSDAVKRHDTMNQDQSPQGVEDPYGDVSRLI